MIDTFCIELTSKYLPITLALENPWQNSLAMCFCVCRIILYQSIHLGFSTHNGFCRKSVKITKCVNSRVYVFASHCLSPELSALVWRIFVDELRDRLRFVLGGKVGIPQGHGDF